MSQEVVIAGELSPREHIDRIRAALENARNAIFDVAILITDAVNQLGKDRFVSEVAVELGMTQGTLSKWLAIASSNQVIKYRDSLPSTFSTLYEITNLERTLISIDPATADDEFANLIIEGKFNTGTGREEVRFIHQKLKERRKRGRATDIKRLVGQPSGHLTIDSLINQKRTFSTFVVLPSNSVLSKWNREDCLPSEIRNDFPLSEVRDTSLKTTLQLLIVIPANQLDAALKMCSAFGFAYRNIFVPSYKTTNLNKELIVVRGERGKPKTLSDPQLTQVNHHSVVELANTIGNTPHLLVVESKTKIPSDWEQILW